MRYPVRRNETDKKEQYKREIHLAHCLHKREWKSFTQLGGY